MSEQNKVGCEREDGFLNIHSEDTTCEVCRATAPIPEQAASIEGLTRYEPEILGDDGKEYSSMRKVDEGRYLKVSDVERLLATQSAKQGAQPSILDQICDLFGIGVLARSESTILANVRNTIRRAECLTAVEYAFFMEPAEPDEDFPDEDPGEECMLGWGRDPQQYVEQFRAALAKIAAPAAQVQADVRDAILEEAAERLDLLNDSSGDAAAYDQRDMYQWEVDREHAIANCAKVIRAMKSKRAASTDGEG